MLTLSYSYATDWDIFKESLVLKNDHTTFHLATDERKITFPADEIEGTMQFHSLEPGFSVLFIDLFVKNKTSIKRIKQRRNEYYGIHYNLTTSSVPANMEEEEMVDIGVDWSDAVLFSSSAKEVVIDALQGTHYQECLLMMDRFWLRNNYKNAKAPTGMPYLVQLQDNAPLQLTVDLTIPMLRCIQEMMLYNIPDSIKYLYYSGGCKRLLSSFFFELAFARSRKNEIPYSLSNVLQAMQLKAALEQKIDSAEAVQTLIDNMLLRPQKMNSVLRFIYNKTIKDILIDAKMQYASEMLSKGQANAIIAKKLGYKNVTNFNRVFKLYFNCTPGQYQVSAKITFIDHKK